MRKRSESPIPAGFGPETVPIEMAEPVARGLQWLELSEIARGRIERLFGGDAAGDVAHRVEQAKLGSDSN